MDNLSSTGGSQNGDEKYCKRCKWGWPLLSFFIAIGVFIVVCYEGIWFMAIFFALFALLSGYTSFYYCREDIKGFFRGERTSTSNQTTIHSQYDSPPPIYSEVERHTRPGELQSDDQPFARAMTEAGASYNPTAPVYEMQEIRNISGHMSHRGKSLDPDNPPSYYEVVSSAEHQKEQELLSTDSWRLKAASGGFQSDPNSRKSLDEHSPPPYQK